MSLALARLYNYWLTPYVALLLTGALAIIPSTDLVLTIIVLIWASLAAFSVMFGDETRLAFVGAVELAVIGYFDSTPGQPGLHFDYLMYTAAAMMFAWFIILILAHASGDHGEYENPASKAYDVIFVWSVISVIGAIVVTAVFWPNAWQFIAAALGVVAIMIVWFYRLKTYPRYVLYEALA